MPCRARGKRGGGGGGAMQCLGARGEEEETRRSAGSGRVGSGRAVGGWRFVVACFFPLSFSLGPRGKAGKRPARRRRGSDVALLGVGGGVSGVGDGGGMDWSTRVRGGGGGCGRSVRVVELWLTLGDRKVVAEGGDAWRGALCMLRCFPGTLAPGDSRSHRIRLSWTGTIGGSFESESTLWKFSLSDQLIVAAQT